jgi:PadR family transcriptional regulator PadR
MWPDVDTYIKNYKKNIRKGFISALILLVLKNEAGHGYKIIKDIKEITSYAFKPASSTVYPILNDLEKKSFIKFIEEKEEGGRKRKIYDITLEGKEALKKMVKNYVKALNTLRELITVVFGIDEFLISEDSIFNVTNGSNLNDLEYYNKNMEERIAYYMGRKKSIEKKILKLKSQDRNIITSNGKIKEIEH